MLERVVVGENARGAVLLRAVLAVAARSAAVYHAPNADGSARNQVFHIGANCHHPPHYFVAGNHGELGWTPLFAYLVNVGVADAGKQNVNCDVVGSGGAARDDVRHEGALADEGGVRFGFAHFDDG
jgi:hypothetical protein